MMATAQTERIGRFLRVHPEEDGFREVENTSGCHMAFIQWYPRWRCYQAITSPSTQLGWTTECLRDLASYLERITNERRSESPK